MRKLSATVFFFALAAFADAEWVEKNLHDENSVNGSVLHRQIELAESETGARAILDLAIFSAKSCRLRLIDNAGGTNDLAFAASRSNCLAAVNGGYFDPNFAPLGLRIIDGTTTTRLTRARLLSGVLASNKKVQIFRVAEFSAHQKIDAAVECGPFLVDLGRPVRGLNATRGARRTFAAMASGDRAVLGFCSNATLAELGRILTTPLGDLKIQRALNLDGGSSSGFWFKRENGQTFSISEQKEVRDFVGIVPR